MSLALQPLHDYPFDYLMANKVYLLNGMRETGIYAILCNENLKVYIGSGRSKEGLGRRFWAHCASLKSKRHRITDLQEDWQKYGSKSFRFLILEICLPEKCLELEQKYLDKARSNDWKSVVYNTSLVAKGRRVEIESEERRKKTSEGVRRWHENNQVSEQTKARLSASFKASPQRVEQIRELGRKKKGTKLSPEQIEQMRHCFSKTYTVTNPDGETTTIVNMNDFCRKNKLDRSNMQRVLQGKQKQYKGWTCKRIE